MHPLSTPYAGAADRSDADRARRFPNRELRMIWLGPRLGVGL
jgi:hypothetical protein